jgi:guanylate kinase
VSQKTTIPGLNPKPLLIVISGPSGAGKDTVLERMKERKTSFHFVITATSRPPRSNEVHGKHYFFYSEEQFQNMIDNDEFYEYSKVYGDWKGVPKEQVDAALASGQDVVIRVDVQGAEKIQKKRPDAILIFISPSNMEETIKRLKKRKTETEEQFKIRIEKVKEENKSVCKFDYLVMNPDGGLDQAAETVSSIINAEHHRVHPIR